MVSGVKVSLAPKANEAKGSGEGGFEFPGFGTTQKQEQSATPMQAGGAAAAGIDIDIPLDI